MATKVLIVDDHPAVREGLGTRIAEQADMELCGQAADPAEALKLVCDARPDVVVVDVHLKTESGLGLVERILAHDSSIRILVCSMYPDALYAQRALRAGALGYINKEHGTRRIIEAIRRVHEGKVFLCEETAEQLLGRTVGGNMPVMASGVQALSDRELEIFRLIGQGLGTAQIAEQLQRSSHTVEAHRQAIKRKLRLRTAAELNRSAVQWMLENG